MGMPARGSGLQGSQAEDQRLKSQSRRYKEAACTIRVICVLWEAYVSPKLLVIMK